MPILFKALPSQEYLKECFDYDPETGILKWNKRPLYHFKTVNTCSMWNTRYSFSEINFVRNGYKIVVLNSKQYSVHRIIWKWMTGDEPKEVLDHINGDRSDNKWNNLRQASKLENASNCKKYLRNKIGTKGVFFNGISYVAQIQVNKKKKYLGSFKTAEEAHEAYKEAALKYHGEFANFG